MLSFNSSHFLAKGECGFYSALEKPHINSYMKVVLILIDESYVSGIFCNLCKAVLRHISNYKGHVRWGPLSPQHGMSLVHGWTFFSYGH
jgi:hypothetical protein